MIIKLLVDQVFFKVILIKRLQRVVIIIKLLVDQVFFFVILIMRLQRVVMITKLLVDQVVFNCFIKRPWPEGITMCYCTGADSRDNDPAGLHGLQRLPVHGLGLPEPPVQVKKINSSKIS
jgi:hypothetical protein